MQNEPAAVHGSISGAKLTGATPVASPALLCQISWIA
jgi:hypothetical protein